MVSNDSYYLNTGFESSRYCYTHKIMSEKLFAGVTAGIDHYLKGNNCCSHRMLFI